MGIDEAGQNDFARAIDLGDFLTILFQPGIAQSVFRCSNGNNFATEAEDGAVFNDAELFEVADRVGDLRCSRETGA